MKYSSLFLDLDNTLLDFNMAEKVAVKKVLEKHNLPHDDFAIKTYSQINRSFWERFERGEIRKSEIFEGRFKTFCETFNKKGDTATLSKEYVQFLSEGYYTVDGAFEILDYLKEKGYKLYATTNGLSTTQYRRIKESGLEPYFDKVFVSEDANHQKPEKEYFNFVLKNIPEKDKSKILVIGDSQSSDILGAINSGFDSCWYNLEKIEPKYQSTYEITCLKQLKDIL